MLRRKTGASGIAIKAGMIAAGSPPVPIRHKAPAYTGEEGDEIGGDADLADRPRRQLEVDLEMRREENGDRVVGDERARHPPASVQGVAEHTAPEVLNSDALTSR